MTLKIPRAPQAYLGKVLISNEAGSQSLSLSPDLESYDDLTSEEITTCSTLRIYPAQYSNIKRTLLQAVASYGPFRKREAQTWFRIDVNKVLLLSSQICIIYDWFKALGWIPHFEDWQKDGKRVTTPVETKAKKPRRK